MSKNLLIIYHSQQGHNLKLAQACKKGAEKEEGIQIKFQKALDTDLEDILWADGLVIVTAEYLGYMSGAVKDLFDRTYYPARENEVNIPYILLICSETDGTGAQRNIERIAPSYTLRKALDTILIKEHRLEEDLPQAEEQGQTFAAGLSMGIF